MMRGGGQAEKSRVGGVSLEGSFVWSLTFADTETGWTRNGAGWSKGAHGVRQMPERMERDLPFSAFRAVERLPGRSVKSARAARKLMTSSRSRERRDGLDAPIRRPRRAPRDHLTEEPHPYR